MPLKVNLRKLRQEAGLTQVDLAERLETAQPYISAIERGRAYPSLQALVEIKRVLNAAGVPCSLDDLVSEDSESKTPLAIPA